MAKVEKSQKTAFGHSDALCVERKNGFITLSVGGTSLVLDCEIGQRPQILYWGLRLFNTSPEKLRLMATRQHAHGSADVEISASLLNEMGSGLSGAIGFSAHRAGRDWANIFRVETVEVASACGIRVTCRDRQTAVLAVHQIELHAPSGLLTCRTMITNEGKGDLTVGRCAALVLPLDARASRLFGFTGRWAGEFTLEETPSFAGSYVRENKSGRTSHDTFPGLIAAFEGTTETSGGAFGFHFGWSGNHSIRVDRLGDGRAFAQMGEYFYPGEMCLSSGQSYQTPDLYAGFSAEGIGALSHQFHQHVRANVLDDRTKDKPRPVHYNTWEAVYFDHDENVLFKLAEKAASVGAERFVLDDGWFGRRRNDKAGLGDWWVSTEVYPDGLTPLIAKVTALGMSFGLWFEPEMVNPDSDLFSKHPDWILQIEGVEQVPFRGQYVLDLTRSEVTEYLFTRLDALLSEYAISYIKWDMNRDIHHPGSQGRAVISAQTRALYALLARLRAAYPVLEIETCSSGGGRADYGILAHTDRIWTSDSNDALDRQIIQRGASHFFPPEIMGVHVGPKVCHITRRRLSMEMRVATAFFGHMGLELNLLRENPRDLETLKAGIALHKQYRPLLHTGDFFRLETSAHVNAVGVVSPDKTEAIYSWANLTGHRHTLPGRIYFTGLDPDRIYRTRIIWPAPAVSRTTPSIMEAGNLSGEGTSLPGEALMHAGLQAPLLSPETCLIYALTSE